MQTAICGRLVTLHSSTTDPGSNSTDYARMLAALGRSVGQVARARTAFAPARMYAVNKEILDDIDKVHDEW